jgi:dienelactone hydrolase
MATNDRQQISRRELFRLASFSALALAPQSELLAVDEQSANQTPSPALQPLNRFPRMAQEYFVSRVRGVEQAALKRKAALKTRAQAEAYVREVREKIRACFGPMPEKTPLNARITGVVEGDTYKIEKVIFESRPGFLVTSNLYIPKGRKFPLPGVVGTCGHLDNAKAGDAYQSFAQGLARLGYVVLIFDPIGQGERLQYPDEQLRSRIGVGVREHLYAGNQQLLVGENFAFWRAWDGIRALDYLLTREEVDPRHIGLTGNSGGGTTTTWLCGLEPRWTMAAPSCFVTTFRRNLENELTADIEQYPPKVLAMELDHDDFLAAMAPKPVIILAQEKDYFDARGVEEAYQRLRRLYRLLGAEENISLFMGPTVHGYSQESREAMYRWFNRATGISNAETEPALALEKDETLWCAPRGQVAELKSRTVFSFTEEKSKALAKRRPKLPEKALAQAVSDTLKIPPRAAAPDARILRRLAPRKYPKPECAAYAVETEPGIHALVYRLSDERLYSRPPRGQNRAVLYVAHLSSDAELREEPLIRELIEAEPQSAFFTCDVRGIGESRPDTCGEDRFLEPAGSDYFYAGHSLMLDQPYVGQKTFDLLRVLDWLKSYGHTEIHLAAKGWGTLPATFAALLSDAVAQVTLKNALTSYAEIAESQDYRWPLSSFAPNALEKFDLPDCYRALERKRLRQIELSFG